LSSSIFTEKSSHSKTFLSHLEFEFYLKPIAKWTEENSGKLIKNNNILALLLKMQTETALQRSPSPQGPAF
jgi:hypothetical protein